MEVDIIPKVRVPIKFLVPTVCRTTTVHITSKDVDKAMLNLLGHLGEIHVIATTSRALDLEVAPVVLVEALEGLDEQEVDSELITR